MSSLSSYILSLIFHSSLLIFTISIPDSLLSVIRKLCSILVGPLNYRDLRPTVVVYMKCQNRHSSHSSTNQIHRKIFAFSFGYGYSTNVQKNEKKPKSEWEKKSKALKKKINRQQKNIHFKAKCCYDYKMLRRMKQQR